MDCVAAEGGLRASPWSALLRCTHASSPTPTGENTMAVTIFVVRAGIAKDREAAFNTWYNEEHVPQVLQYNGAVSARRYKQVLGDDKLEYMAVYEFASEEVFRRFLASDHLKTLIKEYDVHFGGVSERARSGYVQVWP
jgi:antibiotic biosynthesis monooxygenase (ABM) superfamily enzyme